MPPTALLPDRVTWHPLGAGDPGTQETLEEMRSAVQAAIRDPLVVATARRLVAAVPERDTLGEAQALFAWVARHYRYTHDPTEYDLLTTPQFLLRDIQQHGVTTEDCESVTTLLAALLEAVGIRTRFRVIAGQPPVAGDSRFSHVFLEALIGGRWVAFDLTVRSRPPGFRPQGRGREAVYEEGPAMHYTLGDLGQDFSWGELLQDVGQFVTTTAKEVTPVVLPLLERYGVLQAKVGPERLPLPGEPSIMYAPTYIPPRARQALATAASWGPWVIGAAVVGGVLWLSRPRRRRR